MTSVARRSLLSRRQRVVFLTLLVALLAGCETSPPIPLAPIPAETGRIAVQANQDSAAIFLDGIPTGKLTPDTLTATIGTHTVRLEKPGFIPAAQNVRVGKDSLTLLFCALIPVTAQKIVLVEDFSNVSCGPCVISNRILRSLSRDTFGDDRMVVVKYATNFPSPTDPFYLASQAACDERMRYYAILFAPTVIVDGAARPTATDSVAVRDSIAARLQVLPKFSLSVTQTVSAGLLSAGVVVTALDTAGLVFSDLVLHTVVTESNISFSVPPGSNGETSFYDVMRVMLPSSSGEVLQNRIGPVLYARQTPVAQGWSAADLHVIAFIQHRQTGLVLQTGSTW